MAMIDELLILLKLFHASLEMYNFKIISIFFRVFGSLSVKTTSVTLRRFFFIELHERLTIIVRSSCSSSAQPHDETENKGKRPKKRHQNVS